MAEPEQKTEQFGSRWGLIFAALGAAIGTGNIWRFPKETAANGGGAFLIAWVLFLFTWSIPLIIAEFAIGKKTRYGTIGSFKIFVNKKYAWMGVWMIFISTAIGFYYAVVMGWVLRYFFAAATGELARGAGNPNYTQALWDSFISNPAQVVFFQALAIAISAYVVYKGVTKGIERVNKILIPGLFLLLIIAMLWALTLPGSINGLKFMFMIRGEYLLKPDTWIRALAQSAWSCSAGMGMAMTYAVYMRKKEDTSLNAFITGFGNNIASLIAGIAVFCTVFALSATTHDAMGTMAEGSTGLTFVHLTRLFITMPGGTVIAALFFLAMAFAALTSMISTLEASVRNFGDHGWSRPKTLKFMTIVMFVCGLPSAVVVLSIAGSPTPVVLDNQDAVWGLALIVSGLFVAFAVWNYGVSRFREELVNTKWSDIYIGKWWEYVILILFPLQFLVLISWYIVDMFGREPITVGTLILQWGIALAIMIRLNDWLNSKPLVPRPKMDDEDEEVVEAEVVEVEPDRG